jgi:hypothetical protein
MAKIMTILRMNIRNMYHFRTIRRQMVVILRVYIPVASNTPYTIGSILIMANFLNLEFSSIFLTLNGVHVQKSSHNEKVREAVFMTPLF